MPFPILPAQATDLPELVRLINSAYRGEASKKGWTTEADLIQGTQRIDEPELSATLGRPGTTLLKCLDAAGRIVGCVFLETFGERLYLGMLSVSPEQQGGGIGKKLLQAAEVEARERGCRSIYMSVISVRSELVDWYKRQGYQPNGATKPFPTDNKFGTPVQELEFVVLEKTVME